MKATALHFAPDAADAAGGNAADDVIDEASNGQPKDVPYRDAQKLIRERDAAKSVNRMVLDELGLEVELVDDPSTGQRKPQIKGLNRLKTLLGADEAEREDKLRKAGRWEERKAELEQQHSTKVQRLTESHARSIRGRDSVIADLAVVNPLRTALSAKGAVDEGEGDEAGQYDDLVTLLKPKLRTEITEDEETGETTLSVLVIGDDGKPMLDSRGNAMPIRNLVKSYLDKRPHYRKANFRPGFVGGRNAQYGERGRAPSVQEHGQAAAAAFFGQPAAVNR